MKLTLSEVVQVWDVINRIVEIRGQVHAKLRGNLAYLQPESQKFFELSESERIAFSGAEIDLPLRKISEEDLPDNLPANFYEVLNPIAETELVNRKTELEKLIDEEAEKEKEQDACQEATPEQEAAGTSEE